MSDMMTALLISSSIFLIAHIVILKLIAMSMTPVEDMFQ